MAHIDKHTRVAQQDAFNARREAKPRIEEYSSPKLARADEGASLVFTALLFAGTVIIVMALGFAIFGDMNIWLLSAALVLALIVSLTLRVAPNGGAILCCAWENTTKPQVLDSMSPSPS